MRRLLRLLVFTTGLAPVAAGAAPSVAVMHAPVPVGYYVFQRVVRQDDGDGPDMASR